MLQHFVYDGISRSAAELAFYLLFSLFPLVMVLNSLLAIIDIPLDALYEVTAVLPAAVREIILSYMTYLGETPALQPLVLGAVLTLYFLSRAVRSMMHTFADLYGGTARRKPIRRIFISLFMTVFCLVMLASSLVLIVVGRKLLGALTMWLPGLSSQLPQIGRIGMLVAVVLLLVFLLFCYRLLPGVPMSWRAALPGAITSLLCWLVLTRCFAFYVDNMARYSLLYGSIGAVIVLMLWLNLSAITLILGAVFNHVLMVELKEEENRLSAKAVKE